MSRDVAGRLGFLETKASLVLSERYRDLVRGIQALIDGLRRRGQRS